MVFDVDHHLIARQVRRQCTMIAIGLGIASPASSTRSVIGSILLRLVRGDRLLQIFQPELQLIGARLLRAAAEPMP
jgi:hypothetical protein